MLFCSPMMLTGPITQQVLTPQPDLRQPMQARQVNTVSKPIHSTFKCIVLDIGCQYRVNISFVDNGPSTFIVQLSDTRPQYLQMMERINSMSHVPLCEPPYAGMICLGLNEFDNKIYRVVLNSPGQRSCKVS